jgi:DNA polymerase III epsilon subunit-like protein
MPVEEVLVSVDVEASGPSPGTGSLIAIGACLVDKPSAGLYLELKPMPGLPWSDEAERIHGLSREHLEAGGLEPAVAMKHFADWLEEVAGERQPVFVGFNATFDWMFVADYFQRFAGHNPFGHSGLDIKAYYMGRRRLAHWEDTRYANVIRDLRLDQPHTHHALEDAREQAELLRLIAAQ